MNAIHLDACFLIRAMGHKGTESSWLDHWTSQAVELRMSSIAWAEFMTGPLRPGQHADALRLLGEGLPFTHAEAELAAELYNLGRRRRGSMSDCQIAALAIRCGAQLATSNQQDFRRFQAAGLQLSPLA